MPRTGRPREPLTERDMETLGELIAAQNSHRDYYRRIGRDQAEADKHGFAPLQFGGSNGSHHGVTATKLAKRGLAEMCKRGFAWGNAPKSFRGSKIYRPTEKGREAFAEWRETKITERAQRVGIVRQADESAEVFHQRLLSVERAGKEALRKQFPEKYT